MKNLFVMMAIGLFEIGTELLPAQTIPFTFTGTSPVSFGIDAAGTLSAVGTFGTGTLSLSGAGTRMFWYPGKAAFRGGEVSGDDWNDVNIGQYSFAFGVDNIANNWCSYAFESYTSATGQSSLALGNGPMAAGGSTIALGWWTTAVGPTSVAVGQYTLTSGTGAFASGYGNIAAGDYSLAIGLGNNAQAKSSLVLGQYNVGGGDSNNWVATDPAFEIGNGTDSSHPHDALIIDKTGNVTAGGVITCAAGGDIPMFTGN